MRRRRAWNDDDDIDDEDDFNESASRLRRAKFEQMQDLARPRLPKPTCRVKLVCGPPASGKSTLVRQQARSGDIVVDHDLIARELGYHRNWPESAIGTILRERNRRLAALATEPAERIAWVLMTAPAASLRQWWAAALNVQPADLILLRVPRDELHRRILADPDRKEVRANQFALVAKWFEREIHDDPGFVRPGASADGFPTDPLHAWNRQS